MRRSFVALLAVGCAAWTTGAAAADCQSEVAALAKDEGELPRIEIVTPRDRPPYCITLETVMAFAARLRDHVERCPDSAYADTASTWSRTRADYSRLFSRHHCRRTLRN